jgi:esterase/lipase
MSSILQYLQEKVVFLPVKLKEDFQFSFEEKFEELQFETPNEGLINALYFKIKNPKGVILYFHGNADNLTRWGKMAAKFTKFGYDVLVPDYRGYGKSTGLKTEENLYSDAQYCYDFLKKHYDESRIIVYGISLGGTFATKVAGKNNPKKVILECTFFNLQDMAERWIPSLATNRIAPAMTFLFESNINIKKITAPLVMFHGTKDLIVPIKSGRKLFKEFEKAQPDISKKFITIKKGSHADLFQFELYQKEIKIALE